jgi:peptide/nickel transport system substrate-binding protein
MLAFWRRFMAMVCLLMVGLTTACTSASPAPAVAPVARNEVAPAQAAQPKTLRMVTKFEAPDLNPKSSTGGGGGNESTKRLFNAELVLIDAQVTPRLYLAAELPQLNTSSWQVFPDGTMQTTYRLRPNLTWHDGQPLNASDFAFAYRVFSNKDLAYGARPQDKMTEVTAQDPQTVVIKWKTLFPDAGRLASGEFGPLPEHLLAAPLQAVEQDPASASRFLNLPFWSTDYVGAGPYRLTRWEHGAFLEGQAFDGHALGKPKIDRVIMRFMGDPNTILTNLLAGELDLSSRLTLGFPEAQVLQQDWVPSGKGKVVLSPDSLIYNMTQFRPEYLKEPALLDLRVRKALAHTVERRALLDGIFAGQGDLMYTFIPKAMPYYSAADRMVTKYEYNPAQAAQLMIDAGFTKGSDGFYIAPDGHRFQSDFQVRAGFTEFEQGQAIMTDYWRRFGFDVQPSLLPNVQVPAIERHTWPGIAGQSDGNDETGRLQRWSSPEVGSPANRWTGGNRSGYSNPEYDRIWDIFQRTLDRAQRDQIAIQLMKIVADDVAGYVTYNNFAVVSHVINLKGPEPETRETLAPNWNIHEWEMS